jgi:EmrB/QacA subfamily drug resistance transporter
MNAPEPAQQLSHGEIRSIIGGILTAMFLAALDQTIVATAMQTIGRELGDFEHLSWVVTAYLVASTAVTPLYGKLSDIYGRRVVLLVSIATFLVGSMACAAAPTMLVLILARAVQGLGGGGLFPLAQTIIGDLVPPKERARYQVYIASVFVAASLAGPILGGLFAEHLHWSLIFWVNVPLGVLALWTTHARLRRMPRHERYHRLDVLGSVLMVGATVSLMLALNWGGVRYAWTSATVLALFGGSALLWALFALRVATAREPLIPLSVLSNPVVGTATLASCFAMGTFIGLTIYVPVFLQAVVGLSASHSGFALIPLMGGTVAGATLSGQAMARVRHYKRLPMAGLAVAVAGTLVLVLFPRGLPLPVLEGVLAAISLGLGTVLPVTTVSIQNAVPLHQLGTATANMNFFRQLGGAMIVAAFGAILLSGLSGAGPSGQSLEEALAHAGRSAAGASGAADVFRWIFAAAAVCLIVALGGLAAMEERPLRDRSTRAAKAATAD